MTNDEKRAAFLQWLGHQGPERGAKATRTVRARRDALADLTRLIERKHWEHVAQCFSALRYDFGRAPNDEYGAAYDAMLDDAEYQLMSVETGRPRLPVLTITQEGM